jgi:hypothetical protein
MKHLKLASLVALSLAIGAGSAFAQDKKEKVMPSDAVVKYATDLAAKVSADAKLQEALKAATAEHRKLSYDDVSLIDNQWRLAKSGAEKEKKAKGWLEDNASDKSLDEHTKAGEASIKAVREGAVSKYLTEQMEAEGGKVTEIFVMDGWGWNVGQTGGTSDYYQGDEPKWQKPFASGETDVSAVEEEDGIKMSQVSVPVKDGDKTIGAITIGVNVDKVK